MVHQMTRHFLVVIVTVLALWSRVLSAGVVSRDAREALAKVLPEGYRTAAVVPWPLEAGDKRHFVAALVDTKPDEPTKTVRLLHLAWTGRWTILDAVEIAAADPRFGPQYLNGISVVKIGRADLLYVYTNWYGGGSGSLHYFQFFKAVAGHLRLVRSFEHDRMERGLLCLRNNRIYDASIVCTRGEKAGAAYVYTCCLDATEFTYDGEVIVAARRARLEERTGNRYLGETYWNLSLRSVLQRGSHFPQND